MASKSGRAWKMERASVTLQDRKRPRSNKFSKSERPAPPAGSRSRVWVGGYERADGTSVKGHFRAIA